MTHAHKRNFYRPIGDPSVKPKPFVWTANSNEIIEAVKRGRRTLDYFRWMDIDRVCRRTEPITRRTKMPVHGTRQRFISKIEHGAHNATIHAITDLAGGMRWTISYSTQPKLTTAYDQWRLA